MKNRFTCSRRNFLVAAMAFSWEVTSRSRGPSKVFSTLRRHRSLCRAEMILCNSAFRVSHAAPKQGFKKTNRDGTKNIQKSGWFHLISSLALNLPRRVRRGIHFAWVFRAKGSSLSKRRSSAVASWPCTLG